jgi:hypothetical protein
MQYGSGSAKKRNVTIGSDDKVEKYLEISKGRDGKTNLRILGILFERPNLTYVQVAKEITKREPKFNELSELDKYKHSKSLETVTYRRVKDLKQKFFLVQTKGKPAEYSLSFKGIIALALVEPNMRMEALVKLKDYFKGKDHIVAIWKKDGKTVEKATPFSMAFPSVDVIRSLFSTGAEFLFVLIGKELQAGTINLDVMDETQLIIWMFENFTSFMYQPDLLKEYFEKERLQRIARMLERPEGQDELSYLRQFLRSLFTQLETIK